KNESHPYPREYLSPASRCRKRLVAERRDCKTALPTKKQVTGGYSREHRNRPGEGCGRPRKSRRSSGLGEQDTRARSILDLFPGSIATRRRPIREAGRRRRPKTRSK